MAAASNLGQMLNKICIKDQIDLVNIVRKPEQATILKSIGARYICDTSWPTFKDDLTQALEDTGATIAFDATGGGKLAGQILVCIEAALNRPDRIQPKLRHAMGDRRLAVISVPAADRLEGRAGVTATSRVGTEDHLCQ